MENQVDSVVIEEIFCHFICQLMIYFFVHEDVLELFFVNDIMALGTGDQVFIVVEVEKDSRTETWVNLNDAVPEWLFINIKCQGQWKHVPELV